jgi:GT2 family glycosyltransferase
VSDPKVSILISSHNRLPLLRRTLWSIAYRPPSVPFEVVLADDGSDDDILGLLRGEFAAAFPWKFVRVSVPEFEAATGVKRYFNNPALTNNVAFKASRGGLVFLMGNEVIAWEYAFDRMLEKAATLQADGEDWLLFSTTYDMGQQWLDRLDQYGSNLTAHLVAQCGRTPLHSEHYPSDVTNYLSLSPRSVWERLGGYDERYLGGISSDDSDFVRRARAMRVRTQIVPDAVTLHQYHQGKTAYYDPPPSVITRGRWDAGVEHNHAIYHAWDGNFANPQTWPWGTFGVLGSEDNFTRRGGPPAVISAVPAPAGGSA